MLSGCLQYGRTLRHIADGPWIELTMRKTFGDVAFHQASQIYGALNRKFLQAALKCAKYGRDHPNDYSQFVILDDVNIETTSQRKDVETKTYNG